MKLLYSIQIQKQQKREIYSISSKRVDSGHFELVDLLVFMLLCDAIGSIGKSTKSKNYEMEIRGFCQQQSYTVRILFECNMGLLSVCSLLIKVMPAAFVCCVVLSMPTGK